MLVITSVQFLLKALLPMLVTGLLLYEDGINNSIDVGLNSIEES